MKHTFVLLAAMLGACQAAQAATAEEAAQLGKNLTPLGAEKAGNKDSTIPPWNGGYTTADPGFKNGMRRGDPFAGDKLLYSISAKNMDQYSDKLSDGVKALMKKFPSYRIDVYPTRRTAAAPQYVYDNTAKNATRARLNPAMSVENAIGGIPFPIPKNGAEAMQNHLLRWRGASWTEQTQGWLVTAEGKLVMTVEGVANQASDYYRKDATIESFNNGMYGGLRLVNSGPPIRAGEAIVGREMMNPDDTNVWVYLAGQRRTRKLPNACCDTPGASTAGVMTFDETFLWAGRLDRFDWKLVGKKEMYIPYNSNRMLQPTKSSDVIGPHHLNPDHMRWELHRVWVVEANLAPGKRHHVSKSRYYLDEDTWMGVLADRWDANGQLWRTLWQVPVVMPDLPAVIGISNGMYDLLAGTYYANAMQNESKFQYKLIDKFPANTFTADGLSGSSVR